MPKFLKDYLFIVRRHLHRSNEASGYRCQSQRSMLPPLHGGLAESGL